MKTLKQEEINGSSYRNLSQARSAIGAFIETLYQAAGYAAAGSRIGVPGHELPSRPNRHRDRCTPIAADMLHGQPTHFHTGASTLHFTDQVSRVSVRRRGITRGGAVPSHFGFQDVMSAAAQPIAKFHL